MTTRAWVLFFSVLCPSYVSAQSVVTWDLSSAPVTYVIRINGTQIGTAGPSSCAYSLPPLVASDVVTVATQDAQGESAPVPAVRGGSLIPSPAGCLAIKGGSAVIDAATNIWTLSASGGVLKNGKRFVDGDYADELLWFNGNIYAHNIINGNSWWLASVSSWTNLAGDPRVAPVPPTPVPPAPIPTPQPPTSFTCSVPSVPTRYALTTAQKKAGLTQGDLKLTLRCVPETPLVKGDKATVTKP